MDFGSHFVYDYDDSEEEIVSDEELEAGIEAYDCPSDIRRRLPEEQCDVKCAGLGSSPSGAGRYINFGAVLCDSAKPDSSGHHWQRKSAENVRGRRWRRADTNIMSVKFGHLISPSNMHTGDPVHCQQCSAVLNSHSTLQTSEDEKIWNCEFCSEKNIVDIENEEIPTKDDVTFMLQPAPATESGGASGKDESLVIFCVDTSGSMCVTTSVPGRVKLRGDHLDRLQSLNRHREDQFMPGQRRDVTFVSRLQGVQAAVDHQLKEMVKENPDRRVGLVAFNNEVTVLGDGMSAPVHLSGDKLGKYDELLNTGKSLPLPQSVKIASKQLSDTVYNLEEGGQTALGPALLLSIAMASQAKGSKVIICTDGMANIGLGSLDEIQSTDHYAQASSFYEDISQLALQNGVTVSVITIKGTDCKLAELGKVASTTSGQVNIVDPMKLTEEFENILADAIIATSVQAAIIIYSGLYFRHEDTTGNKLVKLIGNVTADTEITFEYGIRHKRKRPVLQGTDSVITEEETMETDEEKRRTMFKPAETEVKYENIKTTRSDSAETDLKEVDKETTESKVVGSEESPSASCHQGAEASSDDIPSIDQLSEIPFQVQLIYTDLDGMQAMRVLTQMRPVTKDRNLAEKEMNPVLLGVHGARTTADIALEGEYTNSRLNAFMYQRMMYRNQNDDRVARTYQKYLKTTKHIDSALQTEQKREMSSRGCTYSDDDDDDEPVGSTTSVPTKGFLGRFFQKRSKKPVKAKQTVSRRMECPDETANVVYSTRSTSTRTFDDISSDM